MRPGPSFCLVILATLTGCVDDSIGEWPERVMATVHSTVAAVKAANSPSVGPVEPVQSGMASYYATGSEDLTAAHPTLPFGARVLVTSMRSKKCVMVEVDDRGPFRKKRIIDLSVSAAKALDMLGEGVTLVHVQRIWTAAGLEVGPWRRSHNTGRPYKNLAPFRD